MLVGAAALLAIAALIGANAYQIMNVEKIRTDIAAARSATESSTTQLMDEMAQLDPSESRVVLARILDVVESQQGQKQLLEDIRVAIADQPEANRPMLEAILAQLETQSAKADALASLGDRLDEVLTSPAQFAGSFDQLLAMQQVNADTTAKTNELLNLLVDQLKTGETGEIRDTQAARLADAAALARVIEKIDKLPTVQQFEDLRQLIENQPKQLETLVARAGSEPVNMDEVYAAISKTKLTLPKTLVAKLDRVLTQIEEQPSSEQLAAAIREAGGGNTATTRLVDELATKLNAQPDALAPYFEEFSSELEKRPTLGQMVEALDAMQARHDAALARRLDEISQKLVDSDTTTLAARQEESARLLGQVLVELKDREPIDQLAEQVKSLAAAQKSDVEPVLADILEAVKARQEADARLAEIHEIIQVWPVQTQARLTEILAEVRTNPNESKAALERVLAELRAKEVVGAEDLRDAIRGELRSGLSQTRFALLPTDAAAQPQPSPQAVASTQKPKVSADASNKVEITSSARPAVAVTESEAPADDSKLTDLQRAYKLAWQRGEPVTVGGGKINPVTGKLAEGRTLDPATARAAGITRWEDWYVMDDFAERMRLQRQAMHHLSESSLDEDMIRLPETDAAEVNRNQAAPAN
jgi:hypothetical protein